MVDVSIIIVSYNVKLFLEQAINSVLSSTEIKLDVIIIDNNSADGSVDMVKNRFPEVKLIENDSNVGFAKACNQGLANADSKYVLFLNPDTVIEKDTISNCFVFAEQHDDVGAIGVQMLDGAGQYLEESKRAFPTPLRALFKTSGLSNLFPNSKFFSGYNLGHISKDDQVDVEVLCGAFMFIRKKLLDEIGGFDESYFMYGEDIDLSYRIINAGHRICYLGHNKIIHYKGQSTNRDGNSYINNFYGAMNIFAGKHLAEASVMLKLFLGLGIFFRKFIQRIGSALSQLIWLVLDGVGFALGFWLIKDWWAKFRFEDASYYDSSPILMNITMYVVVWLLILYLLRAYRPMGRYKVYFMAVLIGLSIILITYGLLPESSRTSRAIILIGSIWVLLSGLLIRWAYNNLVDSKVERKRIGVIGKDAESNRASKIILSDPNLSGLVDVQTLGLVTSVPELKGYIKFYNLNELVFCLADVDLKIVLGLMNKVGKSIQYKIIGDSSLNIIGSSGSNVHGESYGLNLSYRIEDENNRYYKRMFDLLFSVLMIVLSPILLLFKNFRKNISLASLIAVLRNKKTLIGYIDNERTEGLPKLLPAAISISSIPLDDDSMNQTNTSYAIHYSPWKDVSILLNTIF